MKVSYLALCSILLVSPAVSSADLIGDYYRGWSVVGGVITTDALTLAFSRTDGNIDYWDGNRFFRWEPVASYRDDYTVEWTGYIKITTPGNYGFGTMSDDGSQVWIDGNMVVDNRELQWWDWEDNVGEGNTPGEPFVPLHLDAGFHAINVRMYEDAHYDGIELWWLTPNSGPSDIPYYGTTFHGTAPTPNPNTNWQIVPAAALHTTPEPCTLLLLAAGAAVLRRRRQ